MSERQTARALARLAAPGAVLVRLREGGQYGVAPGGDRRRRPVARLDANTVRTLEASGALVRSGDDALLLSAAGRSRVRRECASDADAFHAQHAPIVDRSVIRGDGALHAVRGLDAGAHWRRLAAMRDARGAPWLSDAELAAAAQLRDDWAAAQIGLVRGSDWRAPPKASAPRGGQDMAMAARCDARRRFDDKLSALAPPLRRVVERICLHEDGLEALERSEGWPHRSAKLALKLGLAQLAAHPVQAAARASC